LAQAAQQEHMLRTMVDKRNSSIDRNSQDLPDTRYPQPMHQQSALMRSPPPKFAGQSSEFLDMTTNSGSKI
jgi:hypothetical protein